MCLMIYNRQNAIPYLLLKFGRLLFNSGRGTYACFVEKRGLEYEQVNDWKSLSCTADKDIRVFHLYLQILSHPCYLTQDRIKITCI